MQLKRALCPQNPFNIELFSSSKAQSRGPSNLFNSLKHNHVVFYFSEPTHFMCSP